MKTNIFVPNRIKVGFQERRDTYTGKLAYVIYYDEKGRLRKEPSWQKWRDKDIDAQDFDNVPTQGFVINKKVGGTGYYNVRQTYTRIYDPRGFEFEITVPNLLWILENCDCIKGKGLTGEFVYGWDGTELVLVPTLSPDYKAIMEKSDAIKENEFIKASDLIVGAEYVHVKGGRCVYLGKHTYYETVYDVDHKFMDKLGGYNGYAQRPDKPRFFFASLGYQTEYGAMIDDSISTLKTINKKFIKVVNDGQCSPDYHRYIDMLMKSKSYSPIDFEKSKIIPLPFENFSALLDAIVGYHENQSPYVNPYCGVMKDDGLEEYRLNYSTDKHSFFYYEREWIEAKNPFGLPQRYYRDKPVFIDGYKEFYDMIQPVYGERYLENGNLFERRFYYGESK